MKQEKGKVYGGGGSKGEKMNFLYKRTDVRRAGCGGGRPQSCL